MHQITNPRKRLSPLSQQVPCSRKGSRICIPTVSYGQDDAVGVAAEPVSVALPMLAAISAAGAVCYGGRATGETARELLRNIGQIRKSAALVTLLAQGGRGCVMPLKRRCVAPRLPRPVPTLQKAGALPTRLLACTPSPAAAIRARVSAPCRAALLAAAVAKRKAWQARIESGARRRNVGRAGRHLPQARRRRRCQDRLCALANAPGHLRAMHGLARRCYQGDFAGAAKRFNWRAVPRTRAPVDLDGFLELGRWQAIARLRATVKPHPGNTAMRYNTVAAGRGRFWIRPFQTAEFLMSESLVLAGAKWHR